MTLSLKKPAYLSVMKKLTESKRSEKEQNKDVAKHLSQSTINDIKINPSSSVIKEARPLESSATAVELHDLATTSNENRALRDNPDEANDGEEDIDVHRKEERRAPIELMGEFLKAVMERDYRLSRKLCQMILLYEPENPEAKQFQALLEKKIQLDEAASTCQNVGEDSTESDSSNEDDSEGSCNEDSDENERSDKESGSLESEENA
ncbi:glutamate-rich protein 2 isoform X2 [Narcine bancroftii]